MSSINKNNTTEGQNSTNFWLWLAGALALVSIAAMVFIFMKQFVSPPLVVRLAEIHNSQISDSGSLYLHKGIQITAEGKGVISFAENRFTIISLTSGHWSIEIEHAVFDKRTFFVFPGGYVEPLGTRFQIEIAEQATEIKLLEGAIRLTEHPKVKHRTISGEATAQIPLGVMISPKKLEKLIVSQKK